MSTHFRPENPYLDMLPSKLTLSSSSVTPPEEGRVTAMHAGHVLTIGVRMSVYYENSGVVEFWELSG
jgi:hypothetical protein